MAYSRRPRCRVCGPAQAEPMEPSQSLLEPPAAVARDEGGQQKTRERIGWVGRVVEEVGSGEGRPEKRRGGYTV